MKSPSCDSKPFYDHPDLYRDVFPLDDEEVLFWLSVTRLRPPGPIIDIGAGPSVLAAHIASSNPFPGVATIALDPSRPMLCPRIQTPEETRPARVRADGRAIPVASGSAACLVSRLFGVAYAAAGEPAIDVPCMAAEIRRVMTPGGIVALEIPLAHDPSTLEWEEESAQLDGASIYRFSYHEVIRLHAAGSVLETRMTVYHDSTEFAEESDLFVFSVSGALNWAASAGLTDVRFMPCYAPETMTTNPPEDVRRAVMVGRRGTT